MSSSIEVKILDHKLIVKTDEGEEHTRRVVDYINNRIHEVKENTKIASKLDIAILTAMNIADEYVKTKNILTRLESKTDKLVELIDKKVG